MNWQLFPIFMIKGVLSATATVGIAGAILVAFFMGVDHVGDTFGLGWGFLAFFIGVVFIIACIGFTLFFMDKWMEDNK